MMNSAQTFAVDTTAQPLSRAEVAGLVALAARAVAPLWPLESAIAVNPLSGLEDLPFGGATERASRRFAARASLPLATWRALVEAGRIDRADLGRAAVRVLGGPEPAFTPIGPDVTPHDLLMARLLDLPGLSQAPRTELSAQAAYVAKWCAAFFDQGHAATPMPHRTLGLYRAVLAMLPFDPRFRAGAGAGAMRLVHSVPRDPLEAIAEALADLALPEDVHLDTLSDVVALLPGWAGHIRWRAENADAAWSSAAPASMADLIALWLLLARAGMPLPKARATGEADTTRALAMRLGFRDADLGEDGRHALKRVTGISEGHLGHVFMLAAEERYRIDLGARLTGAVKGHVAIAARPDAQLVFCIDVRSEPFRRAVEARGRYETLGYAGFFGLPIALHRHGDVQRRRLLPVLLAPQHDLIEAAAPERERAAATTAASLARRSIAKSLLDAVKHGAATAFAAAEATGPLAALLMAVRTIAPAKVARFKPDRNAAFAPTLDAGAPFTLAERIGYATAFFRLTGLSADTARLVALVGHGGSAVNNPYAAALDCGACGGHAGGSNARVLTAMLNDAEVRAGMAAGGLAIPAETVFVAGEHDTTTDVVTLLDRCLVPATHLAALDRLAADLAAAGGANRARRGELLGRDAADLVTGAMHWGEVRPEWGLAGNAAFIVAPRSLTAGIDLAGRAFLHSYDWRADADGTALTTILTAPMVVAQWINCQYLFSTIDNDRYGSGDKTTQNVVGGVGVIQGNGGDLKVGLPRQSLFDDDGLPFHLPQRLTTFVLAPVARVEAAILANDILARLFGNGWVALVVIDPETGQATRWRGQDGIAPNDPSTTGHPLTPPTSLECA